MDGLENPNLFDGMGRSGVRRGARDPFGYELAVLPIDVPDVVRSAGGWLCDRVRAGWKVTVFVDEGADVRPLEILGIQTVLTDDFVTTLKGSLVASVAVAADAVAQDIQLLKFIDRTIDKKAVEFTVWGDELPIGLEGRLDRVQNRMSAAAAAFKRHATEPSSLVNRVLDPVEQFHSCGLWYPADGTDLVPIAQFRRSDVQSRKNSR